MSVSFVSKLLKMGLFELTDAHRTNAKSRVSLDETMIPMVTDELFRTV